MPIWASDTHKRMARVLCDALTRKSYEGWADASTIWGTRLEVAERAALAWAALRSLEPDDAELVAVEVLDGAGYPLPPSMTPMEDARWWTAMASRRELKAFAICAFEALCPSDQAAFLAHVGRAVA